MVVMEAVCKNRKAQRDNRERLCKASVCKLDLAIFSFFFCSVPFLSLADYFLFFL